MSHFELSQVELTGLSHFGLAGLNYQLDLKYIPKIY